MAQLSRRRAAAARRRDGLPPRRADRRSVAGRRSGRSDTGYNSGSRPVAEAFEGFAATRLGLAGRPGPRDVHRRRQHGHRRGAAPGHETRRRRDHHAADLPAVLRPRRRGLGGRRRGAHARAASTRAGRSTSTASMRRSPPAPGRWCSAIRTTRSASVPDASQLASLAEIAARHGVTIVSDEVHGPLVQPGVAYTPFLTVSDAAREHGVAITSAIEVVQHSRPEVRAHRHGERAGRPGARRAAVRGRVAHGPVRARSPRSPRSREGGHWLDGVLGSLDDNRRLLADLIADELPGVRYRMPDATYLAWLDLSALGWGDDPADVRARAREGRARHRHRVRGDRRPRARATQLRVHARGARRGGHPPRRGTLTTTWCSSAPRRRSARRAGAIP